MSERCLMKAAQMLNTGHNKPEIARLHCDLAGDLKRIDELCRNLKGELVSRQVIASAIVDWIKRNPDKTPYYD